MLEINHPQTVVAPQSGIQVHGSTVLQRGGRTLIAWFAGSHEGATDTAIELSANAEGGPFEPIATFKISHEAHWNPVLAARDDGEIWLFFKVGMTIDRWRTFVAISPDAGRTWTEPRELVPGDESGGRGPVRAAPCTFRNLWIAGGSVEDWNEPPKWDTFVDISEDDGATWKQTFLQLDRSSFRGAGCIQPAVVPHPPGLVLFTRSTHGSVFRSTSTDGRVWSPLTATTLANNNSGIAVASVKDRYLLCAHNEASSDWGPRNVLALSASTDRGLSWMKLAELACADATASGNGRPQASGAGGVITDGAGEYSYPSMLIANEEVVCSFTAERKSIELVRIPLQAIEKALERN